jgi:hypothetical protein
LVNQGWRQELPPTIFENNEHGAEYTLRETPILGTVRHSEETGCVTREKGSTDERGT